MDELGVKDTKLHGQCLNGRAIPEKNPAHSSGKQYRYRRRLPVPMFSRNDFSVWSILKQCIGKELSKITMPVIFNEPISFLQRIVEYMEYAALLRKASESPDPVERMEYVTAFAISATASNWDRLGKPFNPLLGETYELERDDLGFRICCEQVSHHPPVSAFHAESPLYTLHGTVYPKLKFWGKSVEVTPKGTVTLTLLKHNEVYSWQNVNCCVHNIIVGKLWIEHYGAMEVTNHTTGYKSVLNFKPSGWFDKDLHKVEGCVLNANKKKVRYFYGKWIEGVFSHDVEVYENYIKNSAKQQESSWLSPLPNNSTPEANGAASNTGSEAVVTQLETPENVPMRGSTCNLALPGQTLLWHADHRPRDANQYYSFTLFAMMLNEMEEGMQTRLPPTDCRLRPDIHKLELGHIDAAAEEKNRLEEKQRAARKERRKRKEEWQTRWFSLDTNPHTGKEDWLFNETYWSRDWSNCPEIF